MTRDHEYTATCESRDWQLLNEFTNNTNFFTNVYKCKEYHSIDAYALRDSIHYNVEYKYREMPHDQYDSYFLECDKYAELRRLSDNGRTPLYINFFNDGYTAIWNVDPNKGGINVGEPVKRRSKDKYTSMQEKTAKYQLPLDKAVIYNSTYTRVQ